jgi:hypothetical protein
MKNKFTFITLIAIMLLGLLVPGCFLKSSQTGKITTSGQKDCPKGTCEFFIIIDF